MRRLERDDAGHQREKQTTSARSRSAAAPARQPDRQSERRQRRRHGVSSGAYGRLWRGFSSPMN